MGTSVSPFVFDAVTGTGSLGTASSSPETLTTALNRSGQTLRQVPHLLHLSWLIICTILLPPFLILLFSFIVEMFARMQLKFLSREKKTILEMFMIKDDAEFALKVHEYEFRDIRLHYPRKRLRIWIKDLLLGILSFNTLMWYSFLIIMMVSIYRAFLEIL